VRQEYDRLAPFYDRRWREYLDATLGFVEEGLALNGNERILDAPCGTGELERRLLRRWADLKITGVDLSREMLAQAAAKDASQSVQWIEADVQELPLADASFDWVISANSFHYFRLPQKALAEFRRVLRPDGSLLLADWCDDYLMCKLCSLYLRWTDPAFHRTYSLRRCRSLLKKTGFHVEEARRVRVGRLWGMMRLDCRCTTFPRNSI
jgi:ubiquinone/menaquinone biosynthesis C-methylase UbiE